MLYDLFFDTYKLVVTPNREDTEIEYNENTHIQVRAELKRTRFIHPHLSINFDVIIRV